ncbi:LOW QUALITY PROTEIN: enoyl-CoA delta isomerase 2, mitochondrial [Phyllopteryx taeniolatus]|uniref:LOW QUALITY PROTEIN: enoyl-CoA delta isomerase 2, mitochondrial n=1 Tax=Phyllopteryx taeniolatus TaxID=161469 RepID=UPI002AD489E4|nr:LOW QUALITY PROTEIN: enoyl-CoA delta isomerase 2, mitochondrial [Phyllopteryx taeniolatus]
MLPIFMRLTVTSRGRRLSQSLSTCSAVDMLRLCAVARLWRLSGVPTVSFHSTKTSMMGVTEEHFEEAKNKLSSLKKDPGNDVKLKIYALFKQATRGPCDTPKPGMLDFINKAKWDSWKSLGSITQDEARQQYCRLIGSLVAAEGGSSARESAPPGAGGRTYDSLLVSAQDDITTITLNRPAKKNAITSQMYEEIIEALQQAAQDRSVVTVFTGAGDFYCSGNDLSNFTKIPEGGVEQMAKAGGELLRKYVKAFIDFPKPLVAAVNGPAVGISVTVMGMFDLVYATESATFHTPFSQLGQSPEGCSSYTFPRIMGFSKANEMLLFNKKLTAFQACQLGLVTEVFPDGSFQTEVRSRLKSYAKLPRDSLALSKQLIRSVEKERLHAVNDAEVERLMERWTSDECFDAVVNFFQAKAKL